MIMQRLPLFSIVLPEEYSASSLLYIAKKSYKPKIKKSVTESEKLWHESVVPLASKSVRASMDKSRCNIRKLQLELINADAQLQWLKEQHPDSAFTIQSIQDKLGRIFHLSEGLDIDQFCSTNPFATEA